MSGMVKFYVEHIEAHDEGYLWTTVPRLWNKKVQEQLIANGYTLNEDGTVSKPEEK